ncbi:MAG: ECF transporter S component [Anaeroplasmataceae bacterium]|nr:ECF transporter S component [Anaeroplasmataceae bacterium]
MNKTTLQIRKLCLASMLMAVGWLLPLVTGQIPEIGNMLCPMHIPVFLAGFILGPGYAAMIGFLLPLTRFFIFGMPILYPTGIGMMFELLTYGFVSGILYSLFRRLRMSNILNVYCSLLLAMLVGRGVWGITRTLCGLFPNNTFTWKLFLSGAFITVWPGIILQFTLIPAILLGLKRAHLLEPYIDISLKEENRHICKN